MNMPTTHDLARTFGAVVREWLTPEEFAEVLVRNRAQASALVCHSHDFMDANDAMMEAFERLGVPYDDVDADDERIAALWNAAWDLAKANEFEVPA